MLHQAQEQRRNRPPLTPETLGDTRLVTKPAPTSPFRRFPWIQLVFCLACLTMTAWTWMRYSYCWDISLQALHLQLGQNNMGRLVNAWDKTPGSRQMPMESLRRVLLDELGVPWLEDRYVRTEGRVRSKCRPPLMALPEKPQLSSSAGIMMTDGESTLKVILPSSRQAPSADGVEVVFCGRIVATLDVANGCLLALDSRVGRWHPASIGGLVVGAMGCFIFGLYLRSWLRERKALASQPPQDMIA